MAAIPHVLEKYDSDEVSLAESTNRPYMGRLRVMAVNDST